MQIEQEIIKILTKKSSREHPIRQIDIIRQLQELNRRRGGIDEEFVPVSTLKTIILGLVDERNIIPQEEMSRLKKTLPAGIYAVESKNGSIVGYWIETMLSDNELRYFLDTVLYSKILSQSQVESITRRLIESASYQFADSVLYYSNMKKQPHISDIDTLENIGIIRDAISRQKKIEFTLNVYKWKYNSKTKMHEATLDKLREARYIGSPYEIVFIDGRYFLLIANSYQEKHGGYYYVRVDLMTNIIVSNKKAVSKREAKGHDIADLYNLYDFRVKNPYCYSGERGSVTFRIEAKHFQRVVDQFGENFSVSKVKLGDEVAEEYLDITVMVNKAAFLLWVIQHGQYVEVISPSEYRNEVKKIVTEIADKYIDLSEKEEDQK